MVKYIIIMLHKASIKMDFYHHSLPSLWLLANLLETDFFLRLDCAPPVTFNYGFILWMLKNNRSLPIPSFGIFMFLVNRLFMGQDLYTKRLLPVLRQYVVSQLACSEIPDNIPFVLASHLRRMPQYMRGILQNPSRQVQKFLWSPFEKNQVLYAYILAVQNMFDDTISSQLLDQILEALSQHVERKNILSEIELFAAFMAIIRCIYSILRNGRKRHSFYYCRDDVTDSLPPFYCDECYEVNPSSHQEIDSRDLVHLASLMGFVKNTAITSPFFHTIRKSMYDRLFTIFPNHEDAGILLLICLKAGIWIGYDPHDLILLIRILNCESDVGLEFGMFLDHDHDIKNPFDEGINSFKNPSLFEALSEQTKGKLRELRRQPL
jgi:hypothetical protein